MAEGFRRAGVDFLLTVDKNADACDSYEQNLGHRPVQMDVHELARLARAGMRFPELDLLVADPPCTPWSRAGKRQGVDDPNDCLRVTVELITLLRPTAYLIGNVPGLDDFTNLTTLREIFAPLRQAFYCTADYRSLDAADYGVPQHRVRPFWFGHLEGPCVRWPVPTHCDPATLATRTLFGDAGWPWVTCAAALAHLSPEELGTPVRLRWKDGGEGGDHRPTRPDEPAKTITRNTHSDGALLLVHHRHAPHRPNAPANTITCSDGGGTKKVLAWPWERPSTTLCARATLAPPGRNGRDGTSQDTAPGAIKLSERAAAILQGFPDHWRFCGGTKKSRWAQIGMAMPPPLAHAVATSIMQWFKETNL
jgi:DNA (cytosine-5)-methyltransferase 1